MRIRLAALAATILLGVGLGFALQASASPGPPPADSWMGHTVQSIPSPDTPWSPNR